MRRLLATAACAGTLTGGMLTGTASAASATKTAAADTVTTCSDPTLGGTYYCGGAYGVGEEWYYFPNGVEQLFVIGTDHGVWTRWTNASGNWVGWTPMYGSCWGWGGVIADGYTPSLVVTGSDGNSWANQRDPDGHWIGWYKVQN